MDLDDLLFRYFGDRDLADVAPAARDAGIERMLEDLGTAKDPGQRFALWCLLHMLRSAPDLDVVFKIEADRVAARNFINLLAAQS